MYSFTVQFYWGGHLGEQSVNHHHPWIFLPLFHKLPFFFLNIHLIILQSAIWPTAHQCLLLYTRTQTCISCSLPQRLERSETGINLPWVFHPWIELLHLKRQRSITSRRPEPSPAHPAATDVSPVYCGCLSVQLFSAFLSIHAALFNSTMRMVTYACCTLNLRSWLWIGSFKVSQKAWL